jgi:hypothetical protein
MRRSVLCPRCGAVLPRHDQDSAERGSGACPGCGRGYAWSRATLQVHPPSGPALRPEPTRRRAQAARNCGFPLYGLDESWTGSRWVGGVSGSADVMNEVELAHGDVRREGAPVVRVTTHPLSVDTPVTSVVWSTHRSLSQTLWHEGLDHERVRAGFLDDDPLGSWQTMALEVSGQSHVFRYLGNASAWGAIGEVGEVLVSVFARNIRPEDVKLAVVSDPEQYLANSGATE